MQDELRKAQTDIGNVEKIRRQLQGQVKELQARLDESEAARAGAGKRAIAALEQKVMNKVICQIIRGEILIFYNN